MGSTWSNQQKTAAETSGGKYEINIGIQSSTVMSKIYEIAITLEQKLNCEKEIQVEFLTRDKKYLFEIEKNTNEWNVKNISEMNSCPTLELGSEPHTEPHKQHFC